MKQPLAYVNINGDLIGYDLTAGKKRRAPSGRSAGEPQSFHKGWRVIGIPPGDLEKAEAAHPELIAAAKAHNDAVARDGSLGKSVPIPGPWNPERWMNEAKKTPVRSRPFAIPDSARLCKELAERSGWLRVDVVEDKLDMRS